METMWIVAADASRARIFETSNVAEYLLEIEDLINPEGRANNRELTSDAQGRYYGAGNRPRANAATPKIDAVEHQTELFAKQVGEYLNKARTDHRYDKLHVVAPPKFLGLLRKKMSPEVHKLVDGEESKDLSAMNTKEIETYIKNQLAS